jgi:LCP family protein required for cell wall assembly
MKDPLPAKRSTPTPLGAGLRSLLLPGWGQLAARRRMIGWTLILVTFALTVAMVTVVTSLGMVEVAARLVDPDVLLVVLAANALMAAGRLASTGHAWWARGGRHWLGALVLAVLVLSPHVALAWVGSGTRDMLLEVFATSLPPDDPRPATPIATTPAASTTTTTVPTTTTTEPPTTTTTLPPSTTTTMAPATTTTLPFQGERLNLLLLGGDAGPGRRGLRTDTIMVASFDPVTGDAALFGLPRNYGGFTFSDGTPFPGRILNEVYGWGRKHPDVFAGIDPGASAIQDVAEHITGLDIDYFVLVDLTGFAEVVDAFGGVTLDVPQTIDGPLYDPDTGDHEMIRISTGPQTLDGGQALAYARSRLGSSDYARMARQRCILAAMVEEADLVALLARIPDLTETITSHLTTDLPLDVVPELIRLLPRVSAADIRVVGFDPEWSSGRTEAGYSVPDIERIRAAVKQAITNPDSAASLGVYTATDACG